MRVEKVMIELATLFMLGATMILGELSHRLGDSAETGGSSRKFKYN